MIKPEIGDKPKDIPKGSTQDEEKSFKVDFSLDSILDPVDKLSKKLADVIRGKRPAMVFYCGLCEGKIKVYQKKYGFEPARICVHYQFLGLEGGKDDS